MIRTMKSKLLTLGLFLICSATFAQVMGRLPGVVFPLDRGERIASNLQSIVDGTATKSITLVIDGGAWNINTNLTLPNRVSVTVLPGSYFSVETNMVLTILGNLNAGTNMIFSGFGTAAGPAGFPYRHPSWGSTSQFAIGQGFLEPLMTNQILNVITNFNVNWANGTLISVYNAIVRDSLTIGSNLTVSNVFTVIGRSTNVGPAVFNSTMSVSSNTSFNTNVTVGGDLTVSGAVTLSEAAYSIIASNTANRVVSNGQFIGFLALSASNGTALTAGAFTRATWLTQEVYDTHARFDSSAYLPTNSGYWEFNVSAVMSGITNGNTAGNYVTVVVAKNTLTNALGWIQTNMQSVGTAWGAADVVANTRDGVNGSVIFSADGTSDTFSVYYFTPGASALALETAFNGKYLGR